MYLGHGFGHRVALSSYLKFLLGQGPETLQVMTILTKKMVHIYHTMCRSLQASHVAPFGSYGSTPPVVALAPTPSLYTLIYPLLVES